MKHKTGCLICGEEVIYTDNYQEVECMFCELKYKTNTICKEGHYICDDCHTDEATDIIRQLCLIHKTSNPLEIANRVFVHPSVKMHGPEHHFLVPAALLTAYANKRGEEKKLARWLKIAEHRAANVLGGFCGFYGACGAGVGTGIFTSIIGEATPLSGKAWSNANLMTSRVLEKIACSGGPRCCKRDTYIAIIEAVQFTSEKLGIELELPEEVSCDYVAFNNECTRKNCNFFKPYKIAENEN